MGKRNATTFKKGHICPDEVRKKISETKKNQKLTDEKAKQWKGDQACYIAKHNWIVRKYGKPSYCEHCKRTDKPRYEWSNKDHKYKRKVEDWQRLCVSCHKLYDYRILKSNMASIFRENTPNAGRKHKDSARNIQ